MHFVYYRFTGCKVVLCAGFRLGIGYFSAREGVRNSRNVGQVHSGQEGRCSKAVRRETDESRTVTGITALVLGETFYVDVASRDKACYSSVTSSWTERPVSPGPETEGLSACVNIESCLCLWAWQYSG